MKKLTKLLALLMLPVVFHTLALTAYAHPGRTDSRGGHTDHSTGEYHYHHGYSAHSHYDMDGDGVADCPYDFNNKTSNSSDTSSSTKSSYNSYIQPSTKSSYQPQLRPSTSSTTPTESDEAPVKEEEAHIVEIGIVYCIVVFFIFVICLLGFFLVKFDKMLQESDAKHQKENQENFIYIRNNLTALNYDLSSEFGKFYLFQLCGAPRGDKVGAKNLPLSPDASGNEWGEKYTFYIGSTRSASNKKIHTGACRHANHNLPINAYEINRDKNRYGFCRLCNPSIPDTSWVDKYVKYRAFLEKYNVTTCQISNSKEKVQITPAKENNVDHSTDFVLQKANSDPVHENRTQVQLQCDSRYKCKSFKALERYSSGKCVECASKSPRLTLCKIKTDIGTKEIYLCFDCIQKYELYLLKK